MMTPPPPPQQQFTGTTMATDEPLSLRILSQLISRERRVTERMGEVVSRVHHPLAERGRAMGVPFSQLWSVFANYATLLESQKHVVDVMETILERIRSERKVALALRHRGAGGDINESAAGPLGATLVVGAEGSSADFVARRGEASSAFSSAAADVAEVDGSPRNAPLEGSGTVSSGSNNHQEGEGVLGTPCTGTVSSLGTTGVAATEAHPHSPGRSMAPHDVTGHGEGDLETLDERAVSAYRDLVLEGYAGPAMMHFLAEHMMFTLHCSRAVIPTLQKWILAVEHLKKTNPGAIATLFSATPLTAPPALGGAAASEALTLLSKTHRFVAFVLREYQALPPSHHTTEVEDELLLLNGIRRKVAPPPAVAAATSAAASAATSGKAIPSSSSTSSVAATSSSSVSDPTSLIETFLVDLLCPLASLQRYLHSARCLVESGCLPRKLQRDLQRNFITVAYRRSAEETTLVLDQVQAQDVAQLLSQFDGLAEYLQEHGHPVATSMPSGAILHYGPLVKRYRRGRHERVMYVFSNCFCYVEPQSSGRQRVRGYIPLMSSKVVISEVPDDAQEDIRNAFQVTDAAGKSYLFFASNALQKDLWLSVMRTALTESQRAAKPSSRAAAPGEVPALVRTNVHALPRNSRLERQRREDHLYQLREEHRSRLASSVVSAVWAPQTEDGGDHISQTLPAAVDVDKRAVDLAVQVSTPTNQKPPPLTATTAAETPLGGSPPGDFVVPSDAVIHTPLLPPASPLNYATAFSAAEGGLLMLDGGTRTPSCTLVTDAVSHTQAAASTEASAVSRPGTPGACGGSDPSSPCVHAQHVAKGAATTFGSSVTSLLGRQPSVRRQTSLRGSFSVAQFATELSSIQRSHARVRSSEALNAVLREHQQKDHSSSSGAASPPRESCDAEREQSQRSHDDADGWDGEGRTGVAQGDESPPPRPDDVM